MLVYAPRPSISFFPVANVEADNKYFKEIL